MKRLIQPQTQPASTATVPIEEGAFLQAVVDAIPGMFYVIDERGYFVRWNRDAQKIVGTPNGRMQWRFLTVRRVDIAVKVAVASVTLPKDGSVGITTSIGVAMYREADPDVDAVRKRAGRAPYQAKRSGRDRVSSEGESSVV